MNSNSSLLPKHESVKLVSFPDHRPLQSGSETTQYIAAWFPAAHLVGEGHDDNAQVAEALVDVLRFS